MSNSKAIAIAKPESIDVPAALMLAALDCAYADEDRPSLCGVYIHRYGKDVRVVGTDGHRLFIGAFPLKEDAPAWLDKGLVVSRERLKPRLKMIETDSPLVTVEYGTGSGFAQISDTNKMDRFNMAVVEDMEFPEYDRVLSGIEATSTNEFEAVGVNSKYIGQITSIAKTLDSLFGVEGSKKNGIPVRMYQTGPKSPIVFLFDNMSGGTSGAMLVIMPTNLAAEIAPGSAKLLDPAKRGTMAALKAHITRNEAWLKDEKDPAAQAELRVKIDDFKARLAAVSGVQQVAGPKGDDKPKAPTTGTGDTATKDPATGDATATTGDKPAADPKPATDPKATTGKADGKNEGKAAQNKKAA